MQPPFTCNATTTVTATSTVLVICSVLSVLQPLMAPIFSAFNHMLTTFSSGIFHCMRKEHLWPSDNGGLTQQSEM